jgi:hypothetical protein
MAPRSLLNTPPPTVLRARPVVSPIRGPVINATSRSVSPTVADMLANEARLNAAGPANPPAVVPVKKHKPKSLFGQLGAMATGVVPGVAHFVKDVLTDVVAPTRIAADVIGGHGLRNVGAYLPASTGVLKSFGHTAGDIIHPTHFAQAVRQGTILPKLFEDLGNVAIVAGPLGKAIGAGGALAGEAAGEAASTAAKEGLTRELTAGTTRLAETLPQYRGLAGVAARAGDVGTAQALQRIGNVVQRVGTFGEMPGQAVAKPFELAGKGLARAGEAIGLDRVISPIAERVRTGVDSALNRDLSNIPGLRTLTKVNQAFKTFALPFSTKWHIGNQLGNPMQAFFFGGVGPLELTRNVGRVLSAEGEGSVMRGVRSLWRDAGSPAWKREVATEAIDPLSQASLMQGVDVGQGATTGVRGAVRKAASKSYQLNTFMDSLARHGTYIAKRAAGETEGQALQSVARTFGDYATLSPVERDVMRQVMPFYPWVKHSVGATLAMPLRKPGTAMFLGGLSDRYNDPNNPTSPLIGQRLPFGNKLLNLGTPSPLGDLSPVGFALSPFTVTSQLSPAIKGLASIGLGIDLGRNLKGISRPAGTAALDEFGRPTTTPPWMRLATNPGQALGEIGWQLAQQGPAPVRSLRDLILGDAQRYAGTGYQYGRKPDPNRSRLLSLLRLLQVPTVEPMPS